MKKKKAKTLTGKVFHPPLAVLFPPCETTLGENPKGASPGGKKHAPKGRREEKQPT
jgi:hypothetical protein